MSHFNYAIYIEQKREHWEVAKENKNKHGTQELISLITLLSIEDVKKSSDKRFKIMITSMSTNQVEKKEADGQNKVKYLRASVYKRKVDGEQYLNTQ